MKLNELSKDLLKRYVKKAERRQDYNLTQTLKHYDNADTAREFGNKRWERDSVAAAKKLTAKHRKRDEYLIKADAKIAEETQLDERSKENKIKKNAHAIKLGYDKSNYALFPKKPDRPGGLSAGILHKFEMDDSGHSKEYFYKKTADHLKRAGRFAMKKEEAELQELSALTLSKYLIAANATKDKREIHKKEISRAFQKWIAQKEEREALAELSSKSTLSYFNKACFSRGEAEKKGDMKTVKKRERGAFRAIDSIAKKEGLRSKPKRSLVKVRRYAAGTSFEE